MSEGVDTGTVAIVGLGIMGGAIAQNLLARGVRVAGYDTDPGRRIAHAAFRFAADAADAAREAAILLTSLPSVAALDATARRLADAPGRARILAELSTLPIEAKERAAALLKEAGVTMLDCPLSGTGAQAVTGDLAVYASGESWAVDASLPVFAKFARVAHDLGAFGNGSRMKFVANLLVAVHNVASAEAMVLGMKAGLDPKLIAEVIPQGAGNSRIFELRAPLMAQGAYTPPTMKLGIWQKDMDVIAAFAQSLGVPTPTFSATRAVYDAALDAGRGGEDTAAVCAVLEQAAGVRR